MFTVLRFLVFIQYWIVLNWQPTGHDPNRFRLFVIVLKVEHSIDPDLSLSQSAYLNGQNYLKLLVYCIA